MDKACEFMVNISHLNDAYNYRAYITGHCNFWTGQQCHNEIKYADFICHLICGHNDQNSECSCNHYEVELEHITKSIYLKPF